MAEAKQAEETEASAVHLVPATSERDRELALLATREFESGDYENCLATITKLAATRGHDLKVMHNQAVAAYYKSGLTKTDEFKRALSELYSKVSLDDIAALDDVDQCIIYYNHAVILYYLKQYKAAFSVLDKVMQFIEPMDENISRKVAFLMVELYLCTHQPYKALGMLSFIEKTQFNKASSPDKEESGRDSKDASPESDTCRSSISQYKLRCFLMLKSIKSCKREMKTLGSHSQGPALATVFLKSQFEYSRGNYEKALRMLSSTASHILNPSPSVSVHGSMRNVAAMYFNDLGVAHFHLRKHNLGAFYLRRAAQENMAAVREAHGQDQPIENVMSTTVLPNICVSRHYEIMYNLGIELLHCSQPQLAFDCLLETLQQFQVNPCLWLRLAECCIMAHRANNNVDRSHTKKMEVVSGPVGSGLHQKLILGSGVRIDRSSNTSESTAIPMASMEFAALCLDNAILLLPDQTAANQPAATDSSTETRCSVLACRAYVALYHSDYLVALKYAESLLRQPKLSGAHRYLAHMYMAECLAALDCIADSIDHLNPDNVTDITTVFPTEQKSEQERAEKNGDADSSEVSEHKAAHYPWSPNNVHQAKAIMIFNLASTHAMRGEHEKALQHLGKVTQLIGHPLPAQMYYLKIYLELMEGRRKVVHSLLRDHFTHLAASR